MPIIISVSRRYHAARDIARDASDLRHLFPRLISSDISCVRNLSVSPPGELRLTAFTYEDRGTLLPLLIATVVQAGGWVLKERPASASNVLLEIELQNRDLQNLYAGLVESGVELTRSAHLALAGQCACKRHLPKEAGRIAGVHLAVAFLSDAAPADYATLSMGLA